MRELETEVNRKAEEISRQFPEVAELFETTPKDIAQLKASIAPDTVVIQPVLLTNVNNVPNTVALFVLTKDSLSVKKIAIDPAEFDKLLTEHREEISNDTHFRLQRNWRQTIRHPNSPDRRPNTGIISQTIEHHRHGKIALHPL